MFEYIDRKRKYCPHCKLQLMVVDIEEVDNFKFKNLYYCVTCDANITLKNDDVFD